MWVIAVYVNAGLLEQESPSSTYAARPSINLTSEIVIKSGSGTKQDPFIVGLPDSES